MRGGGDNRNMIGFSPKEEKKTEARAKQMENRY